MTMRARAVATLAVVALVAAPAAERRGAKGIVPRLADGRLAPDQPLTRLDVALFLAKTVGVQSNLRLPDYRDPDQIPVADRQAVAAASSLGTVSAKKVEIKKGTVVYTLSTNKVSYAPDKQVELTFT